MNPRLKTTILIILVSLFVGPHVYGKNPSKDIDITMTGITLTDGTGGSLTVETFFTNASTFKEGNPLAVNINVDVFFAACSTLTSLPQVDCPIVAEAFTSTFIEGVPGSATVIVTVPASASYFVIVLAQAKGDQRQILGFASISLMQ